MSRTNYRTQFNKWNTLAVCSEVDVRLANCTLAEGTVEKE